MGRGRKLSSQDRHCNEYGSRYGHRAFVNTKGQDPCSVDGLVGRSNKGFVLMLLFLVLIVDDDLDDC